MPGRGRNQTATLWQPAGRDWAGEPTGWTVTSILVRWEEGSRLFTRSDGTEAVAQAVVFLGVDVEVGDRILLGTSIDPTPPESAKRIEAFRKVPSLRRGGTPERRAML